MFIMGGIGFIGANLILKLLREVEPITIISVDNRSDYYDVSIKDWRLEKIKKEATKHPASSFALEHDFGIKPATPLRDGLRRLAEWYKEFYEV